MSGAPPPVRLSDVRFAWPGRGGFGLGIGHFEVAAGERVFLVGESGSGKSTLLSLICGIVAPQAGRVEIAGTDLGRLSRRARDRFRAETIGIVFQTFNLLPYASARDNVLLPLSFAPERRRRLSDPNAEADRLMRELGLDGSAIGAGASGRLSVGQQQRVAVARALIGGPALIVADEPTSSLDARSQAAFLDVLFEQAGAVGAALIMVSHDDRLAGHFDRMRALSEIAGPVPAAVA